MAKAIIKINAFVSGQQFKDIHNFIYDQLKAGLEVITVPSYCDVYVLNGADIDIQKDVKIETASEKKECRTCKYEKKTALDQPCRNCCHNTMDGFGDDKWEAKENE